MPKNTIKINALGHNHFDVENGEFVKKQLLTWAVS